MCGPRRVWKQQRPSGSILRHVQHQHSSANPRKCREANPRQDECRAGLLRVHHYKWHGVGAVRLQGQQRAFHHLRRLDFILLHIDGAEYEKSFLSVGDALSAELPEDPEKEGHEFVGWDWTRRAVDAKKGGVVAFMEKGGRICAVRIVSVSDRDRGADKDELQIEYRVY